MLFKETVKQGTLDLISRLMQDQLLRSFYLSKYPSIKPLETIEGIRMMSLEDIAAMKVNAIVNSGERVKDFIDIYYLLNKMNLEDILDHYSRKYPNVDVNTAISSLSFHQDINLNVPVILKDKTLKWKDVSKSINNAVYKFHEQQRK